uniref:Putative secreted peptide n=1 Tax=Anopheles braziliensis TaxID=58242 RepID=A0A2M3ZT00_9DIPT
MVKNRISKQIAILFVFRWFSNYWVALLCVAKQKWTYHNNETECSSLTGPGRYGDENSYSSFRPASSDETLANARAT